MVDVAIAAFFTAYLTYIFILSDEPSSAGPLVFKHKYAVFFEDTNTVRPYGLFDFVRTLFGAYRRMTDETFIVREFWADVWMCRWCLSFWVALLSSFIFQFAFIYAFAVAGVANLIMGLYDGLQVPEKIDD